MEEFERFLWSYRYAKASRTGKAEKEEIDITIDDR